MLSKGPGKEIPIKLYAAVPVFSLMPVFAMAPGISLLMYWLALRTLDRSIECMVDPEVYPRLARPMR